MEKYWYDFDKSSFVNGSPVKQVYSFRLSDLPDLLRASIVISGSPLTRHSTSCHVNRSSTACGTTFSKPLRMASICHHQRKTRQLTVTIPNNTLTSTINCSTVLYEIHIGSCILTLIISEPLIVVNTKTVHTIHAFMYVRYFK